MFICTFNRALKLALINNVNLKKRPSVGFFTDAGLFIRNHYTLAHFPFVNAFEMCTLYRCVQTYGKTDDHIGQQPNWKGAEYVICYMSTRWRHRHNCSNGARGHLPHAGVLLRDRSGRSAEKQMSSCIKNSRLNRKYWNNSSGGTRDNVVDKIKRWMILGL